MQLRILRFAYKNLTIYLYPPAFGDRCLFGWVRYWSTIPGLPLGLYFMVLTGTAPPDHTIATLTWDFAVR